MVDKDMTGTMWYSGTGFMGAAFENGRSYDLWMQGAAANGITIDQDCTVALLVGGVEVPGVVDYVDERYNEISFNVFFDLTVSEPEVTETPVITYDEETLTVTAAGNGTVKLYVDGEPVEYTKALGALIAFEIEGSGEHTGRLKYAPKTFTLGLTISILSTALFVLIIIIEKPLSVVLSKIFSSNEATEKEQDTEDDELANSENENDDVE